MPASRIAVALLDLRLQFLDGLSPTDRETIFAAVTGRRYFANSVITNPDRSSDLFLLTKGLVRYLSVTEEGKKVVSQWLGPGEPTPARCRTAGSRVRHETYASFRNLRKPFRTVA